MDSEVAVILIGCVVVAVTLLGAVLRSRSPWPYPAEDCRRSCPNSGACDDCEIEYP